MSLIKRLRFGADCTTERIGENLLTDAKAHLLKPSACRFEVTLLLSPTALQDIADLDQLTLSVKLNDPRTGLALMQKTVNSGALNALLTFEEFQNGDPDECHAVFEFSAAETNLDLTAVEEDFYLVLEGLDGDGKQIAFADGEITVEESGAFAGPPASVIADGFYTKAQSDSRYVLALDISGKLDKAGGTMTGALTLSGAPSSALHAATKAYVDAQVGGGAFLPIGGGTLTGLLTLSGAPTNALHAATKAYADLRLPLAGGTMTGLLTLSGAPSANLHAATKLYVDTADALKLPLAGGTMTGLLTLSGAPTDALHAATKTYVDTAVANLVASSPAALDTLNELAAALGNDANFSTTITTSIGTKVAKAGDTMTGALTLSGAPTSSLHAATKAYVDAMLPLAGGTMSGLLTLSGAPTDALHAATKTYVDSLSAMHEATKVSIAGEAMTGALSFSGTGHLGLRVNNLTNSQAALVATANGNLYYDTTLSKLIVVEGGNRKQINTSGGTTWLAGSGDPGIGDGADGNYYLKELDGSIWRKASGTWAVIVAARLPAVDPEVSGTLTLTLGDLDVNVGSVNLFTGGGLNYEGLQILGARGAAVADATDNPSAITQLNLLLARLRTHGLIAT